MAFDDYYSANPVESIDTNRWDVYDPIVAMAFRQTAFWTPLMTYIDTRAAPDKNTFLGTELIPGHVNHNAIGFRQMYVDPMTWDSRRRRITGVNHYGAKVQLHKQDPLLNMWISGGMNDRQFLQAVARRQLAYSVVAVFERMARDFYIQNCIHKFYGPHGEYADFSGIQRAESDTFKIDVLPEIKLRLTVRSKFTLGEYGTYNQPVPGRPGNILIQTTPGVVHDIWTQKNDFMVDLRTLQDNRILHGGAIDYQGFTVSEGGWGNTLLWNAGMVDKQVAVTQYLQANDATIPTSREATGVISGDGAPDPEVEAVDDYLYVGQSAEKIHYLQCTDFDDGDFSPGDFVSIHTIFYRSTGTLGRNYFGIDYGCPFMDGNTQILEVYSVDHTNNRLAFRSPVMSDYNEEIAADASTLVLNDGGDGSATYSPAETDAAYAIITKAQHIHPVLVAVERGAHRYNVTEPVRFHLPVPIDDFETVWRLTWDSFGAPQVWSPDLYEMYFVSGSMANRALVGY